MKLLLVLALVVVAVVAIALPDPYGHHHHHHHNGTRWTGGRWNGTRLFNRTAGRPRFTIPRIPIPVLNGSQPIPNPDVQIPEIPNPAIPIPINGGNGFF
uniref:Putative salivary secreted peptide n=1 Tax=Aedes albopictus TaxID=7160 RepID=A0A1W7R7L9_AEDAL